MVSKSPGRNASEPIGGLENTNPKVEPSVLGRRQQVAQRIADGRVLRLIEAMLKAGSYGKGRLFQTERGTPQGGVVSPRRCDARDISLQGTPTTGY